MPDAMADIRDHALAAVEKACVVCRHVQRRLEDLRAMTKDDASPVTIGDFASQAVIIRELKGAGAMLGGIVAEESAAFLRQPEHARHLEACVAALRDSGAWPDATADEVVGLVDLGGADPAVLNSDQGGWTLDPIDGTKGFLRGEQYCVALAMIRRGRVELGILGCPNLLPGKLGREIAHASGFGTRFWAAAGQGAYMRYRKNVDSKYADRAEESLRHERLLPNHPARLAESIEIAHTRRDLAEQIMRLAGPTGPTLPMDSQCKYAVIARGDADVYLRLPSKRGYVERIWDHAAGMLICQEAGCVVTDIRGRPLDFSHGRGLEVNEGILGAPPDLHARLLKAVAQAVPPAA